MKRLLVAGCVVLAALWVYAEYRAQTKVPLPGPRIAKQVKAWPRYKAEVVLQLPQIPDKELEPIARRFDRPGLLSPTPAEGPGGSVTPGFLGPSLRALGVWELKSPDGECQVGVLVDVDDDGNVTLTEDWVKFPAATGRDRKLFEIPAKWRLSTAVSFWPEADLSVAVGLRALRVGRWEVSPALLAGYDFSDEASRAGVGLLVTFDF